MSIWMCCPAVMQAAHRLEYLYMLCEMEIDVYISISDQHVLGRVRRTSLKYDRKLDGIPSIYRPGAPFTNMV